MIDDDVTLMRVIERAEVARERFSRGLYVEARAHAQSAIDDLMAVVVSTSQREGSEARERGGPDVE